jgi:hypothetical protein
MHYYLIHYIVLFVFYVVKHDRKGVLKYIGIEMYPLPPSDCEQRLCSLIDRDGHTSETEAAAGLVQKRVALRYLCFKILLHCSNVLWLRIVDVKMNY